MALIEDFRTGILARAMESAEQSGGGNFSGVFFNIRAGGGCFYIGK